MTDERVASTADDTVLELWIALPEWDSRLLTEFAADLRWRSGRWQDICSPSFQPEMAIDSAYQRRIELVDSTERCRIARMEYSLCVHRQGSTS